MCKLVIEQYGYKSVEFEVESPVDAAILIETLKPYAPEKSHTKFTITTETKIEIPEDTPEEKEK